jgi:YD repeat-containing protein
MIDAAKVMVVDDTIDQPVNTREVTATDHRYTYTAREKEKADIANHNDGLEDSTSCQTPLTKHSVETTECSNRIEQTCQNQDIKLTFPHQEDKQSVDKLPRKSKCQIQSESSVFFCSEGCFQQTSDNKLL